MRIIRSIVLAIVAALVLLGSIATTADAGTDGRARPWHLLPEASGHNLLDPGDPGFPPDIR